MTVAEVEYEAAADEICRRRRARQSLIDFTSYVSGSYYIVEPMHVKIAEELDNIVNDRIDRLLILAPPQHGKTRLTSNCLPAYWLGKRPDDPVIITSYGAHLAQTQSQGARDVLESTEYMKVFPERSIRKDRRAIKQWALKGYRGYVLACGVKGPITGHGGLLGLVDDALEGWHQAQSKLVRDSIWEWYRSTFRSRIWEKGKIVVIMTRWHEQDLAGKILTDADQAGRWRVLRLPAIAETRERRYLSCDILHIPREDDDPIGREPGEPLSPKRFSLLDLEEKRRDMGALHWDAGYQQVPRAAEGNTFKREWFRYYGYAKPYWTLHRDDEPRKIPTIEPWYFVVADLAVSLKQEADWTVVGAFGVTKQWELLVMEIVRKRIASPDFIPLLQSVMGKWGAKFAALESVGVQLGEIQRVRKTGLNVMELQRKPGEDKMVRSLAAQVRMEAQQIFFPDFTIPNRGWLGELEEELLNFKLGCEHDDQVDVISDAAQIVTDRAKFGRDPGVGSLSPKINRGPTFAEAHQGIGVVR